ncbi:MAG: dihydrolipoamide acetyltransferase family protein [Rhabdaerophilum sp.]
MPVEVILPKVDMDMETGTIEAWKVVEGEAVTEGQLIFEIGTSKAVMEVEAPASGIIRRISAKQGETVAVGASVAWIYGVNEAIEAKPLAIGQVTSLPKAAANDAVAPSASHTLPTAYEQGIRATPLARRIAREAGISLADVRGSGPRGRIGEADIRAHLAGRSPIETSPPEYLPSVTKSPAPFLVKPSGELVPFSSVRKIVAQRLTESATSVPHFYLEATIDLSNALSYLKQVGPEIQAKTAQKPSLTAFIAHVVGHVLVDHPLLNASVEGEAVRLHQERHIGIAMDRDGDLVVPVLRGMGSGRFVATVIEFARLRKAVAERSLTPSDMQGGTFTISNLGMFGVDRFTAIINPPQTGILAVGRTVETPVGLHGAVVLRPMANLCLSADHRVVDGVIAARFMSDLRAKLENPYSLI